MSIKRAFRLFEHDNGRLEAEYLVFDEKGNLEKQENVPTATLPGALVALFFASPDQLPDEFLSALKSTEEVGVAWDVGSFAGDEVGLKDVEKPVLNADWVDGELGNTEETAEEIVAPPEVKPASKTSKKTAKKR